MYLLNRTNISLLFFNYFYTTVTNKFVRWVTQGNDILYRMSQEAVVTESGSPIVSFLLPVACDSSETPKHLASEID